MLIECSDGAKLACTLTLPTLTAGTGPPHYVVINSATGVRQRFYSAFAQYLADAGFHVLTWDPRGIGESRRGHAKHDPTRMRDWGVLDMGAVLLHARALAGGDWSRVAVIGHSAGGHLSGLSASLTHINRLVLVASGTCDWRLYPSASGRAYWAPGTAWYPSR